MNDFGIPNVTTRVQQGMDLIDEMEVDELNTLVDYIRHIYKTKRSQNAARKFATLAVGDRVRYLGPVRPGYLEGKTGEIVEKRQTRLVVQLDCGPIGKFRSGRVIAQPASLEKIEG